MENVKNIQELESLKNDQRFDEIAVATYVLYNIDSVKEAKSKFLHRLEKIIAYFHTHWNEDGVVDIELFKKEILGMNLNDLKEVLDSDFYDFIILDGTEYYMALKELTDIIDSQSTIKDKYNIMKDIIIAAYFLCNKGDLDPEDVMLYEKCADLIAPTNGCKKKTYYFGKRGKEVRILTDKVLQNASFWRNESLNMFNSTNISENAKSNNTNTNKNVHPINNLPNKIYLPDEIIEMFLKTKHSTNLVAKLMSNDGYKYAIAINEIAKLGIPYKKYIETIIDIESVMWETSKIDSIIKTFPRSLKSSLNMRLETICSCTKAENMISYLITYLYLIYNGNDSICGFSINDDNKDVREVHMKNLQATNEVLSSYVDAYAEHTLKCVIIPRNINELPYLYKIHCSSIQKDENGDIVYYFLFLADSSFRYKHLNGDFSDKVTTISRKFINDILNLDTKIITESGDIVIPFISDGECIEYYKDVLEKRKATILENIDKVKKASTEMENELIKKLNSIETIINDL